MSIIQPEVYSYKDTDPYCVYGEALLSGGLEVRDAINGVGLVTNGLVWQQYDIWCDIQLYDGITTSWSAAAGSSISTTWTDPAGSASLVTNWSNVQYGLWGDYPPE